MNIHTLRMDVKSPLPARPIRPHGGETVSKAMSSMSGAAKNHMRAARSRCYGSKAEMLNRSKEDPLCRRSEHRAPRNAPARLRRIPATPLRHPCELVAHEGHRLRPLQRALPQLLGHLLVQGERLRRRGDHGDADPDVGLLAEPERGEHQDLAVG